MCSTGHDNNPYSFIIDTTGTAVVYGTSLAAFTTIQALLEAGLSDIVSVQPPTPLSCFNNPHVVKVVEQAMADAGKCTARSCFYY